MEQTAVAEKVGLGVYVLVGMYALARFAKFRKNRLGVDK